MSGESKVASVESKRRRRRRRRCEDDNIWCRDDHVIPSPSGISVFFFLPLFTIRVSWHSFYYLFISHRVQADGNPRFMDATNSFSSSEQERLLNFLSRLEFSAMENGKCSLSQPLDLLQFILDLLLPSYISAWVSWFFRSRNVSDIWCSSRNKVRAISNSRKPTARAQKMGLNTQREAGI